MTKDIKWASKDDVKPGNSKYADLLKDIKVASLRSARQERRWAELNRFPSDGTARDLAVRLSKRHKDFEFIARKRVNETVVFAKLKDEVAE